MEYFIIVERTLLFYILITFLYRFMGKREIGQLGIVDLIVSILIAELSAMCIDSRNESVFLFIIPIILLVIIQIITSYISLKSNRMRDILDGTPSVMINKGIINFREMIKQRYNIDDLLAQLREQHIRNIEEVDYAILEPSGKLSVFKKINNNYGDYPLPIILDGTIQKEVMKQLKISNFTLERKLKEKNTTLEKVFYAFYKNGDFYVVLKDDLIKN